MIDGDKKHLLKFHKLGLVKPFVRLSRGLRKKIIEGVKYNTNLIPHELVYLDLLTDSLKYFILPRRISYGRGRIESSSINLKDTFRKYFGYKFVLPIAQGRMAEIILAKIKAKNAMVVPSNMLFVTTRIHQELNGATVCEIPVKEAYDLQSNHPFKGNMDTTKLEQIISENGSDWVAYVYVETCVNASGGHPVSMQNIRDIYSIAKQHNVPVILDACRILENAYFIKERERGYGHKTIPDILKEFCSHSDGCTMSASKDFFVENGGFLATNRQDLYYQAQDVIMVFGDGLTVRDKAALNDVLHETFNRESKVYSRIKKVYSFWRELDSSGLPVVRPQAGHAVFLDASQLHESLPVDKHPEKAFLAQLYISFGVRGGENILSPLQKDRGVSMLRFTVPACMYSLENIRYAAKSIKSVWRDREKIKGLKKISQPPSLSGSFFAEYELL